jgi:lipoate-protein ligase B
LKRSVKVVDLGLCDYDVAYRFQLATIEKLRTQSTSGQEDHDYLILVEHPEVYTFGRKSDVSSPNLFPVGKKSVEIERGGEATYHNPGQLVAYPILKLDGVDRDIHLYLRQLELAVIRFLNHFGLKGESRQGATGVWLEGQNKKIASIGIAVKHWITFHGVAININNDLSGFASINPCGFSASVMTSLSRENPNQKVTMEQAKASFIKAFGEVFSRKVLIPGQIFC